MLDRQSPSLPSESDECEEHGERLRFLDHALLDEVIAP